MHSKNFLPPLLTFCIACNTNARTERPFKKMSDSTAINPYRFVKDIPLPKGYSRICSSSFAGWLRNMELKKDKTVYLFNGSEKQNQSAQFAVLNISTGNKDLQQCADAVMRLRAEYLFANGGYNKIVFTDNENKAYQFTEPYTKEHLHDFLETVFSRCGSASLSKQLHSRPMKDIEPGDVIIKGGFPGHAVIVMDVAINETGKKIYMLAQSYMPAQDIHILVNPSTENQSPWYEVNEEADIITPQYTFYGQPLKTW